MNREKDIEDFSLGGKLINATELFFLVWHL